MNNKTLTILCLAAAMMTLAPSANAAVIASPGDGGGSGGGSGGGEPGACRAGESVADCTVRVTGNAVGGITHAVYDFCEDVTGLTCHP